MRPFPKIHDVYVGRVVLGTVILTWAVLAGLIYPAFVTGAWLYVRQAERNERHFAELVDRGR